MKINDQPLNRKRVVSNIACNYGQAVRKCRMLRLLLLGFIFINLFFFLSPGINEATAEKLIHTVGPIGMTVSDMDRSVEFYTNILSFKKVSDVKVYGNAYEHLLGAFWTENADCPNETWRRSH